MILKFKYFSLFFLVLNLLTSCGELEDTESEIESIPIDFLADTIGKIKIEKIIALESRPEAIIGHVSRITMLKDRIYILDNRNRDALYLFDGKGNFLNKTQNGKGPGECLKPVDYCVKENDGSILVLDRASQRFNFYDLDLNYQKGSSTPKTLYFNWFDELENNKWLVFQQSRQRLSDKYFFSYLVYSETFEHVIDSLLPDPILSNEKLSIFNPISRESSQRFFCRPFDQNLYTFEHGKVKTKYYLDFDSYNLKESDKEKEYRHVYQLARKGERVTLLGDLMNSDQFIAVSFMFQQKQHFIIYSKNTKKVRCSMYSESLPKGVLKGMANKNTFMLIVEPLEFLDYISKHKLELAQHLNIRADGNQILVLFSLLD